MYQHSARNPHGTVIITHESGAVEERDSLQCCHCGLHWVVQPGSGRVRGWCMNCVGPHCGSEHCTKNCQTVEQFLERLEKHAARQALLAG